MSTLTAITGILANVIGLYIIGSGISYISKKKKGGK